MRKLNVVLVFVAAAAASPLHGQQVLPTPAKIDQLPVISLYGMGSVTTDGLQSLANDPAAKITVGLAPASFLSLYGSLNKGAGASESSSAFKDSDLLWPEAGNTAFLGNAKAVKHFLRSPEGCLKDGCNRIDVGALYEFSLQDLNVSKNGIPYSFNARRSTEGADVAWLYYIGENRFKLGGSAFYTRADVPSGQDATSYRAFLGDANASSKDSGWGYQLALNINDNAFAIDAVQIGKTSNSADTFPGWHYRVTTTVAAKALAFGSIHVR
jgi:hypothetical protein